MSSLNINLNNNILYVKEYDQGSNKYYVVNFPFKSKSILYWLIGDISFYPFSKKELEQCKGVVPIEFFGEFITSSNVYTVLKEIPEYIDMFCKYGYMSYFLNHCEDSLIEEVKILIEKRSNLLTIKDIIE